MPRETEILWYNSANGSGAIGAIDATNSHVTLRTYSAGAFASYWNRVASVGNRILWYDSTNGSGAIGTIDTSNNHVTLRTYPSGSVLCELDPRHCGFINMIPNLV